jgi:uncharacterized membrane protein YcaP (DUF421 family)
MWHLAALATMTFWDNVGQILYEIYGGDYPDESLELYQVAARAVTVYVIGLAIVRLGKSRIMARATALDVILGFILGSLLSRAITGYASMSGTFVASGSIVALHWIFTNVAFYSHSFGKLIKGNSRPIVFEGKLMEDNMRRSHVSLHDLMEHCRLQGVKDLDEIQEAHKERNGEISIIRRRPKPQIVEVSVNEGVQTVRIALE